MKVSELQTAFITELSGLLKGWQFVITASNKTMEM